MSPSRNAEPIDDPKTPNPVRLAFYDFIGEEAVKAIRDTDDLKDIQDTDDLKNIDLYHRFVGVKIVQAILDREIYFSRNGELIDLSRWEDQPEPPHWWTR